MIPFLFLVLLFLSTVLEFSLASKSLGFQLKSLSSKKNGLLNALPFLCGGRYTLTDFNSDNQADLLCETSPGYYSVAHSTGSALMAISGGDGRINRNKICNSLDGGVHQWIDLNKDERADLYCNWKNGTHEVWYSNGFTLEPINGEDAVLITPENTCESPNDVVRWVDINNDGNLDMTCFSQAEGLHRVFLSSYGQGKLESINGPNDPTNGLINPPGITIGKSARYETNWADFNGDGFPDLIVDSLDGSGTHYIWLNINGEGIQSINGANDPTRGLINSDISICPGLRTTWGDFNGDSKMDLLCSDDVGGLHYVWKSTGSSLTPINPQNSLVTPLPTSCGAKELKYNLDFYGGGMRWLDINNDGYVDLVCDNIRSGQHKIFFSRGNSLMSPNPKDSTGNVKIASGNQVCGNTLDWYQPYPSYPNWVDFNGDGILDLICISHHSGFHWGHTLQQYFVVTRNKAGSTLLNGQSLYVDQSRLGQTATLFPLSFGDAYDFTSIVKSHNKPSANIHGQIISTAHVVIDVTCKDLAHSIGMALSGTYVGYGCVIREIDQLTGGNIETWVFDMLINKDVDGGIEKVVSEVRKFFKL